MKTLKLVKDTRITLTPQKEYDYFTWDMCLRIFVRLNSAIEWRKYCNKRKKKLLSKDCNLMYIMKSSLITVNIRRHWRNSSNSFLFSSTFYINLEHNTPSLHSNACSTLGGSRMKHKNDWPAPANTNSTSYGHKTNSKKMNHILQ